MGIPSPKSCIVTTIILNGFHESIYYCPNGSTGVYTRIRVKNLIYGYFSTGLVISNHWGVKSEVRDYAVVAVGLK